jgi:hypothetical protein
VTITAVVGTQRLLNWLQKIRKYSEPPSHTTHRLQPPDRTFMQPLKEYYCKNIRQCICYSEQLLGPYCIAELFGKACLPCQRGNRAVNGFRKLLHLPVIEKFSVMLISFHQSIRHLRMWNEANQSKYFSNSSHNRLSSLYLKHWHICSNRYNPLPVSPREIWANLQFTKWISGRGLKATSAAPSAGSTYKGHLQYSIEKSQQIVVQDAVDLVPELRVFDNIPNVYG